MSYQECLEKAGATIVAFQQFGSYQGEWWAKVVLPDGRRGWINGAYGSCSGCDAFESEIGCGEWDDEAMTYKPIPNERLADFGRRYLDGLMTQGEAIEKAAENIKWDTDAEEMVAFLRDNAWTETDA